ncbi:hypothetical protein ABD73_10890 [Brevibacillus laterosporus]|nr:hypothetical protein [Brevibacillus laterosporus]
MPIAVNYKDAGKTIFVTRFFEMSLIQKKTSEKEIRTFALKILSSSIGGEECLMLHVVQGSFLYFLLYDKKSFP